MVHFPTTALPLLQDKDTGSSEQASCEASGGTWDAENRVCIPAVTPTPTPREPTPPAPPGTVITNADTGEPSGFINSAGQFVKAGREDIQNVVSKQAAKTAPIEGGVTAEQIQERQRIQQLTSQIGSLGQIDPSVQADINFSQAVTAGLARVGPGAVGGAAIGATAGLVGTAGALSIPGAIAVGAAGAVTGFVSGILSNIREQQKGELQAADIELRNARTSMRQLAMLASQDPSNADVYIQQFNAQLTRVHQARRQTKAEVTGDLNSWIEDGREQLADFDAFLQEGGIADIYGQKLSVSLSTGVPLSINGEGLLE